MSGTETKIGKVKEIKFIDGTTFDEKKEQLKKAGHKIEEFEKNYLDCDTLCMIEGGRIFEIVEEVDLEGGDIAEAIRNSDGTISYTLQYYNGGACFEEMLEEAVSKMEKKE